MQCVLAEEINMLILRIFYICADRCFSKHLAKLKNTAWERCKCFQIQWFWAFLFKPILWLLPFLEIRTKISFPGTHTRARQFLFLCLWAVQRCTAKQLIPSLKMPATAAFKMSGPEKSRARPWSSKAHHYLIDASHESLNHCRSNEKDLLKVKYDLSF